MKKIKVTEFGKLGYGLNGWEGGLMTTEKVVLVLSKQRIIIPIIPKVILISIVHVQNKERIMY